MHRILRTPQRSRPNAPLKQQTSPERDIPERNQIRVVSFVPPRVSRKDQFVIRCVSPPLWKRDVFSATVRYISMDPSFFSVWKMKQLDDLDSILSIKRSCEPLCDALIAYEKYVKKSLQVHDYVVLHASLLPVPIPTQHIENIYDCVTPMLQDLTECANDYMSECARTQQIILPECVPDTIDEIDRLIFDCEIV